jgi:Mrp family chromosome partitioning ATPase
MIIQIYLPVVLWTASGLAILLTLLTYSFNPVYSATTVLSLDSDLIKVLRNLESAYPSASMSDFIRYEYFATHSVSLMRLPQLAKKVVETNDIRDHSGNRLRPEYFIQPGLTQLIFTNDGQGINVEWISDTQTFAIKGYSRMPKMAVVFSRKYAEEFLVQNADQYKGVLQSLLDRFDYESGQIAVEIENIDRQSNDLKIKIMSADMTTEIENVTKKILTIKNDLESAQLSEKIYRLQLDHLLMETKTYEKYRKAEQIYQLNPQITTLKTELDSLIRALAAASIDYTHQHPEYLAIEKKIQAVKQSLKNEAEKAFSQETEKISGMLDTTLRSILALNLDHLSFKSKVTHYSSLLDNYNQRLNKMVIVQSDLSNLAQKKGLAAVELGGIFKNRHLVESMMNKTIPFFRIVSHADINEDNLHSYKYFPNRKLILLLTFSITIAVLALMILGRELHTNTLYYDWQLLTVAEGLHFRNLSHIDKSSADIETLSGICSAMHDICLMTKASHIIRIVSWNGGEGKATLAKALAWYHRKMGESVLLVDGDSVNASLTRSLDMNGCVGLLDMVCDQKTGLGMIQDDRLSGISVIPVGNRHSDIHDDVSLAPMTPVFTDLAEKYSKFIFIDCPSSQNYVMLSDLLPRHDVILVIESGKHAIHSVEPAVELSQTGKAGGRLKWIVINKALFGMTWNPFRRPHNLNR